jgi:hypothetical protein
MVGVGVSRDEQLARGQVKIHPAYQIDNLGNRVQVTDVDEKELTAAVDEIDVDPQPPPSLVIQLDDVRKKVLPLQHGDCPEGGQVFGQ